MPTSAPKFSFFGLDCVPHCAFQVQLVPKQSERFGAGNSLISTRT